MNPTPNPQPFQFPHAQPRNGKVARLPKFIRDQINLMLLDGIPYPKIIERLPLQAQDITEDNLGFWKSSGYVDWLRELQLAADLQDNLELAQAIVALDAKAHAAAQALLKTIAADLSDLLSDTGPASIREKLLSDPDTFTCFLSLYDRLNHLEATLARVNQFTNN